MEPAQETFLHFLSLQVHTALCWRIESLVVWNITCVSPKRDQVCTESIVC